MISRPRGKFIVFEGIDGCGKDTQLDLAAVYVRGLDKYNEIYLTREPTWRAPEIRKKMGSSGDPEKEAEWFARAFIYEDRVPHILEDIEPALEKGWHVLSSRFEHSTEAYQSAQGISLMKLIHMHAGLLAPDLTLIYDCPVDVAYERMKKTGKKLEIFEKKDFLKKVRKNYLILPRYLSQNIVMIDSTKLIDEVFQETKKHLDRLFGINP